MIHIAAKLKCGAYNCDKVADITLELKVGSQGIPTLNMEQYPEGWGWGWGDEEHCCPEHRRKWEE